MAMRSPVGISETLKEEGGFIFLSAQLGRFSIPLSIAATRQFADQSPRRSAEQTAEMHLTAPSLLVLWGCTLPTRALMLPSRLWWRWVASSARPHMWCEESGNAQFLLLTLDMESQLQ